MYVCVYIYIYIYIRTLVEKVLGDSADKHSLEWEAPARLLHTES